jgi:hypothetical protein
MSSGGLRKGIVVLGLTLPFFMGAPVRAQRHPVSLELGAGTLSPDDPFSATLAMRAALGYVVGGRNAVAFEYLRQSANGSEGEDLGKFARHLIGFTWQHALGNAFMDQDRMKQQYLIRLGGGILRPGTFPEAVEDDRLATATFVDLGVVIRYPFSSRIALVGTIEDAVAFLPTQSVRSYCGKVNGVFTCYPRGGPDHVVVKIEGRAQHNFGVFATLQLRP